MSAPAATSGANSAAAPFAVARGRERGYDRAAVDELLTRARHAFEGTHASGPVTSRMVRQASFPLRREGYRIDAVDAALARIEDAFAARERDRAIELHGEEAWMERARRGASVLLERLSQPPTRRFSRAAWPRWGYDIDEVDRVTGRIAAAFRGERRLGVEQVRQVAFSMRRRGYREEDVDEMLDAVIDVLLALGR